MKVGTFVPEQLQSVLYAMAGDDCSLHHDLKRLTPKQQVDHQENQILTCALQVALTGLGKAVDYVALGDAFEGETWSAMLAHYGSMFSSMGLETVPRAHHSFHDLDDFYQSISRSLPQVDLVNLYMFSGSNETLHANPDALEVSRNVNSKLHFALNAPVAGIPVPDTRIYTKSEITKGRADDFFSLESEGLMVKLLGLAGARNVFRAENSEECLRLIQEYDDSIEVLLQAILCSSKWQEMTVDLTITPDSVDISNVRKILFAGGKWVGNYIGSDLSVSAKHREVLLKVGAYAREHGYVADEGVNCGIDYFIDGEDVMVTEINARWTGGLFPAEFLRRLGVTQPAIAFFDVVPCDALNDLKTFQKKYLFPAASGDFSYIPMGFTPFATDIDGATHCFVWQLVVGNFEGFVRARKEFLSEDAFPTANLILKEALI